MYKYDTVHGRAGGEVTHDTEASTISIDGKPIKVFGEMDPTKIEWGSAGADYVIESTGVFTSLIRHLPICREEPRRLSSLLLPAMPPCLLLE